MAATQRFDLTRLVAGAELPLVLAIAPALLFPTPLRLTVLSVVPIVWLCAWKTTGRIVPPNPMNAALGLMLIMVGVSLNATFDIHFSLGKVSGVILGVLLFWAITRWIDTEERLKIGTWVFLLAGATLAIVGLLGTNWESKFSLLGRLDLFFPRLIRGVPGAEQGFNPNAVAGCLLLFVPLQVAFLATGEHRWLASMLRRDWAGSWSLALQILLLLLTSGTLLLTQSEGAWAALVATIIAVLFWLGWRLRALAAAIAVIIVITLGAAIRLEEPLDTAIGHTAQSLRLRVLDRAGIWSMGVESIKDFPLTGTGMNTFRVVAPDRYAHLYTVPPYARLPHSHNHLLQAGVDLGIPGLVAYVSIWLIAGFLLVTVRRRSHQRRYRTIATGLGASLIAHFIFSLGDVIPLGSKPGVLFWFTLALTVALHRHALVDRPVESAPTTSGRSGPRASDTAPDARPS